MSPDSLGIGYVWTGPGAYHTFIFHTNEETGDTETIVEGYPENEIFETPLEVLFGQGWGNLQKEIKSDSEVRWPRLAAHVVPK